MARAIAFPEVTGGFLRVNQEAGAVRTSIRKMHPDPADDAVL
jgi:hypothetical protein